MIKLQKNIFEGDFPLTQLFGVNKENYVVFGLEGHNGIDYATPSVTTLYSCINGTIIEVFNDTYGYGKYIKIENDECGVLYAHMRVLSPLSVGSEVKAGDIIGETGNTGNSTGPHLHFGVFPKPRDRSNGFSGYINPLDKNLVEWVENLNNPQDPLDDIATLTQKIYDLKEKLDTERDEHIAEVVAKDKIIEQQQKQSQELTVQLVSARKGTTDVTEELKLVRGDYTALKEVHSNYVEESEVKVEDLAENLKKERELVLKRDKTISDLKNEINRKVKEIGWFEFIWSRIRR